METRQQHKVQFPFPSFQKTKWNKTKINKACPDKLKPGTRNRRVTTRCPPKQINNIKNYFPLRWSDPEVRIERTGGRWVVVGDSLSCRGVAWQGLQSVILIKRMKLVAINFSCCISSLQSSSSPSFSRALTKFSFKLKKNEQYRKS